MSKKRKSDAARLEEVDRTMYSAFCTAANSLSQLYTQATNHQKLSFQAGERHALDKLYQWIIKQQEEGSRVNNVDILAYLQHELDYGMEGPPMSPRAPPQQQFTQQPPNIQAQGNLFAPAVTGLGVRSAISETQAKNVFTNALSSPVRRSLQHYHLARGTSENNRETNSPGLNDSSMDMNSDSPSHEPEYWR